jgi:hypothetical protein
MKESNCESSLMNTYCQEVHKLEDKFRGVALHHIPQRDNKDADALAKMAAQRDPVPNRVFINDLHAPSIHVKPDPPQRPSDPMPGGPCLAPPDQASLDQGLGGPDCLAMEIMTAASDTAAIDSD